MILLLPDFLHIFEDLYCPVFIFLPHVKNIILSQSMSNT